MIEAMYDADDDLTIDDPTHHDLSDDDQAIEDLTIECATCPATGTTACGDCIVTHLLANDDGPIEYTPMPHGAPDGAARVGAATGDRPDGAVDPCEGADAARSNVESVDIDTPRSGERSVDARAMGLLVAAGLLDDPPRFVSPTEFADGASVATGPSSEIRGTSR